MDHEDLNPLLLRYAAGDLDEAEAVAVRTHLATGCSQCLATVFQPHRNGPEPDRTAAVAATAVAATAMAAPVTPLVPGASRAPRRLVTVLGITALLLAAAMAWVISLVATRERERGAAAAQAAARLEELDRARTELERARADLERTRGDLEARTAAAATARTAAEEEARRQTEAAEASAEANAELARRLESAEARVAQLARGVRSREAEIGRLLAGAEVRALGDLAATPGVEVLRLVPTLVGDAARGHVLWHPARERIMLYVFGLPAGPYRVRLWLDGNIVLPGPALRLGNHGEAATAIDLGFRAARLRALEVLRERSGDRILEGRLPAAR